MKSIGSTGSPQVACDQAGPKPKSGFVVTNKNLPTLVDYIKLRILKPPLGGGFSILNYLI